MNTLLKFNRMKNLILGLTLLGSIGSYAMPSGYQVKKIESTKFRSVKNTAFAAGEMLRYRIHYGVIDAGEAVISVKETKKKVKGRSLLHVVGTGRSLSGFDMFFKVRDRYESYIDKDGLFPWVFVRRVNEGGYKLEQDYTFFQHMKKMDNGKGKKMAVPSYVQDMISSFFYARAQDYSNIKVGDEIEIKTMVDEELFNLKVKFMGKETIKLRKGKFRCMKFQPIVMEGRVFESSEDLQVWITDDENRIPILAKANILVGSVKMEVVEYKGLLHPIAKVEK